MMRSHVSSRIHKITQKLTDLKFIRRLMSCVWIYGLFFINCQSAFTDTGTAL